MRVPQKCSICRCKRTRMPTTTKKNYQRRSHGKCVWVGGAISWAFRLLINDQYPQNVSAVWIMCAPLIVIFALYLQLHGSIVMPKNCLNFIDLNLIFHFERHFRLSPSHHNFHISNAWDNQWLGMIRINFQMNSKLKVQWHTSLHPNRNNFPVDDIFFFHSTNEHWLMRCECKRVNFPLIARRISVLNMQYLTNENASTN